VSTPPRPALPTWLLVLLASVVPALLLLFVLIPGCSGTGGPTAASNRQKRATDEALEQARETLSRASDLTTCRTALQQINLHLGRNPERRPATLTTEQVEILKDPKQFGLNAAELSEVDSSAFTALDGQHLDLCFLFRDAARSLETDGLSSEDRANRAFAWTVRQVRLREGRGEPAPPHFVLRRGFGSELERGLVFLTLLEQLDVPGCLLGPATDTPTAASAWGCGALTEAADGGKQVIVYDLRLGLPLPGTLGQLRKQPGLLKPLTVDPKHPHDLTAEQLQAVRIYPSGMLSALSARMRYLQFELPEDERRPRLAIDPVQRHALWKEAAGDVEVQSGKAGVRVLRQFVSEDEGGTDRAMQMRQFESGLVPWGQLPRKVLALEGEPGARLQSYFGMPFRSLYLEPGGPRDALLRGRAADAARDLVEMRREMDRQKQLLAVAENIDQELDQWIPRVIEAHAEVVRAQAAANRDKSQQPAVEVARAREEQVYKEGLKTLVRLLDGTSSAARSGEVLYLLALCMHEQAERLEGRLDKARRAGREPAPSDVEAARDAWKEAAARWEMCVNENAATEHAAAGRTLWARSLAAQGDTDKAVELLEDLSGNLTPREKTARLYQASVLKKK
jgi:hypothetical protein